MDKEHARFILQSFRPDGADAHDPDFAEALVAATEDRELGEWLAAERAEDAAFASALAGVEIPDDLRETILTVLRGEASGPEYSEMDDAFASALASVRPPHGLRDQIVNAMAVESRNRESLRQAPRRAWNWLGAAAVAAVVVLGAFAALELTRGDDRNAKLAGTSRHSIEQSAIQLVSSGFTLDVKRPGRKELVSYLAGRDVPTPSREDLPPGLAGVDLIGCKVLSIGENQASLICFDKKGLGTLHLVVVRLEDLKESLPGIEEAGKACWQCPKTKYSVASWSSGEKAYFLLGKLSPEELRQVF